MTVADKRILVVEDDAPIRTLVTQLLQSEGYDVVAVSNGYEALDALKSSQPLPSLIFLDLMMPLMDGFQFRKEQKSDPQIADIPVVIMSADGNVKAKKEAAEAVDYLKKPVSIDEILTAVSRYSK